MRSSGKSEFCQRSDCLTLRLCYVWNPIHNPMSNPLTEIEVITILSSSTRKNLQQRTRGENVICDRPQEPWYEVDFGSWDFMRIHVSNGNQQIIKECVFFSGVSVYPLVYLYLLNFLIGKYVSKDDLQNIRACSPFALATPQLANREGTMKGDHTSKEAKRNDALAKDLS